MPHASIWPIDIYLLCGTVRYVDEEDLLTLVGHKANAIHTGPPSRWLRREHPQADVPWGYMR
jgi:hypothetical protein